MASKQRPIQFTNLDLHTRLKARAAAEGVTMTALVEGLVARYLDAGEPLDRDPPPVAQAKTFAEQAKTKKTAQRSRPRETPKVVEPASTETRRVRPVPVPEAGPRCRCGHLARVHNLEPKKGRPPCEWMACTCRGYQA